MSEQPINDQILRRREELDLLEEAGVNPYPYSFDKTHDADYILNNFNDEDPDALKEVAVAGRIMSIRRMGKASFIHLQDITGKIQIYLRKNEVPDYYEHIKKIDIGDILGVKGYAFGPVGSNRPVSSTSSDR